jgi:hypothetical protein
MLVDVFIARYWLRLKGVRDVRSFHLVTHSRAMFFSGTWLTKWFIRHVFMRAPAASSYFMNDAAKFAHEAEWNCTLTQPVLRLPIGECVGTWSPSVDGRLRIVSVGRLVPFKSYNLEIPAIVAELVRCGVDASWTIWGDGPDRVAIEQSILENGVEDRVVLRGALEYERMAAELAHHDVFVGMGTALLEAAGGRMPAVCAIENAGAASYGFLSEAPIDSVGDLVSGHGHGSVTADLLRFAGMTADEKRTLADLCAEASSARGDTIDTFVEAILQAGKWHTSLRLGELVLASLAMAFSFARNIQYRLRS